MVKKITKQDRIAGISDRERFLQSDVSRFVGADETERF